MKYYRHNNTHEVVKTGAELQGPWTLIGDEADLISLTEKLLETNAQLEFALRQKLLN